MLYSKYVVHGVRERDVEGGKAIEKTTKGQRAQYYTMYGIDRDGHEMAVADFKKKADADALASELNGLLDEALCRKAYARIQWLPVDVKELRPKWSLEKCEDELGGVEKYLACQTTELGWEVLDQLLPSK